MRMGKCCIVQSSISLTNCARPACLVWPLPSSLERSQPGDADVFVLGLPHSYYAPRGGTGSDVVWLASRGLVLAAPRAARNDTDCRDARAGANASAATRVPS